MNPQNDKILVIGPPGAGKSRFAKKLSELLSLPVVHLDNLLYREDKTRREEEFQNDLDSILFGAPCIIDGHHFPSLEERLQHARAVYFLDFEQEECELGRKQRCGISCEDRPFALGEEDEAEFSLWWELYQKQRRQQTIDLLRQYPEIEIIELHNRKEADSYLEDF
ncbi:MAG: adenylate kinase [Bacilli bacterium]|nr:adenylate kinase [Bacilli bacterium]